MHATVNTYTFVYNTYTSFAKSSISFKFIFEPRILNIYLSKKDIFILQSFVATKILRNHYNKIYEVSVQN